MQFQPPGYEPKGEITSIYDADAPGQAIAHVFESVEVPRTRIYVFSERRVMRMAWVRASSLIEAAEDLSDAEFFKRVEEQPGAAGFDLRGRDILSYLELRAEQPPAVPDAELRQNLKAQTALRIERNFVANHLLPDIQRRRGHDYVYIALDARPEFPTVATHELNHALYFQVPEFRAVCDDYYRNRLTQADRETFLTLMVEADYRNIRSDPSLASNEFQAYALATEGIAFLIVHKSAALSKLAPLMAKHREALTAALAKRGLAPATVPAFQP